MNKTKKTIFHGVFVFLFLLGKSYECVAQNTVLASEISIGRIVPNYSHDYPSATPRLDASFRIGRVSSDKYWGQYFNKPEVGLSAFYSYLGNSKVFGNQLTIYPYINFKVNDKPKPLFIKLGIGLAHFNKPFDAINNRQNVAIGSLFTWHFSAGFEKTIRQFKTNELFFTGGYYHASNGHTQIPNYGLNSALLGLMLKVNPKTQNNERKEINSSSYWVLEHRSGVGFHELAGTAYPVGGPKYLVFSNGFNVGYVHREHIKYKAGFIGRYYDSYFQYIQNNYGNATIAKAGNVYMMAGAEFLLGHVGLDIEGGLNLYKPFFKEFYEKFDHRSKFDFWSKQLFNTRMGLYYYLLDCYGSNRMNIKFGVHINANFGQADFSDASVGVLWKFKK